MKEKLIKINKTFLLINNKLILKMHFIAKLLF